MDSIPLNRSSLHGRELECIFHTSIIGQIAGDQTFSKKCHTLLQETLGVKRALVIASIIGIFAGTQFVALGIIGEYLAGMHFRAMDKPTYAVLESTDADCRTRPYGTGL